MIGLREEMKHTTMKKGILLVFLLLFIVTFSGCGNKTVLTGKTAEKALQEAKTLNFSGNLDDTGSISDIEADGRIVGRVEEHGSLYDTHLRVIIGGKDKFFLRYVTGEPVNNQKKNVSGTTYGYYNTKNECVGYAQERWIKGKGYQLVFLDKKGKSRGCYAVMKDYYDEKDRATEICVKKDKQIGTSVCRLDNYLKRTFDVRIKKNKNKENNLEYLDMIAVYWKENYNLHMKYYNNDRGNIR